MIAWEDSRQFPEGDTVVMASELESLGAETRRRHPRLRRKVGGRYWFTGFKRWMFPFVRDWLWNLRQTLCKDVLRVMDFGCYASPFPAFLAYWGYEIWGVDNGSFRGMKAVDVRNLYPGVSYHLGNVETIPTDGFDAIFSCSVLEHIPRRRLIPTLDVLRGLLQPKGKMLHIVDYYFPGCHRRNVSFYHVAQAMGFPVDERCPGAPGFDFETLRPNVNFLYEESKQARIAIGDDL